MKAAQLVDRFVTADPSRWTFEGGATVSSGELVVPVVEAGLSGTVTSVDTYDLTDSHVLVELLAVPTTVRSQVRLVVYVEGSTVGEFLAWEVRAGELRGYRYDTQVTTEAYSAPWSPVAHRWLKIGEADGVITWSTSHDGLDWTPRASLSLTIDATSMRLALSGALRELADPNDDDGLEAFPARFDNLNAPPAPPGGDPLTSIATDGAAPNLAIDVQPETAPPGTFELDRSLLDGGDQLGWGDGLGGWENVVADGVSVRIRRGMTSELGPIDRAEAGSCTISLADAERRFDPTVNAGVIHPGTPIRVRAWAGADSSAPEWSAVLFTGTINTDGIGVAYSKDDAPAVVIVASDLVADLARWESAGRGDPGVGAGDDLLERVQRVLDETGHDGALAAAPDPAYKATLGPTVLDAGWATVDEAARAELGRVWVDVSNRLAVRARGAELSGPVRGTLSDWHGEAIDDAVHCCYADPGVRYDSGQLVNRAIAGRRGGDVAVQLDDEPSQARYGDGVVKALDLNLENDAQLEAWAGAIISGRTEPRVRVDSVAPTPATAPEAWQAVASTDIGDRWHFRLHPTIGPTVAQTIGVLGIEHDITPEVWSIAWTTAKAPTPGGASPSGWFLLDASELDGGDLLAPFA